MIRLDNWYITGRMGKFDTPNFYNLQFHGVVTNHPCLADGKTITFFPSTISQGRKILTQHNTYTLGKINPDYRKWLKEHRPHWNWRSPLTWM